MNTALEALHLFLAFWLLAQVEIHVEGDRGWAEGLPTWRWSEPWLLRLTNGKPVTGYHVCLTAFLLAMFHLPLLFVAFSRAVEARILSYYFLATVFWDFQWFVWNPAWGVRRYFRETVWWFPKRMMGLPVEYYTGIAASFLCTWLLWPEGLRRWAALVACLLALSAASVILAEWSGWRPAVRTSRRG